ncbi:MAG TPA: GAF domain-containing protein [Candidatus Tectomicrobia bacterium]|nr:GAF domain-containing protein [Candidatus Tectomicrobia bacterium]
MDAAALLRRVGDLGRAVARTLDLEAVLRATAEAVTQLRPDVAGLVWVVEDSGVYRLGARAGPGTEQAADFPAGAGSLADIVTSSHEPLLVEDATGRCQGPSCTALHARGLTGYFAVPLLADNVPQGALAVHFPRTRPLTPEEREAIQLFSSHAAAAILNARLYRRSEERRRAAEAIAASTRLLSRALDARLAAEIVVEAAQRTLQVPLALVMRLDDSGAARILASAGDVAPHFDPKSIVPPGRGTIGRAIAERRLVISPNVLTDARITLGDDFRRRLEESPYRATMAVPLFANDVVQGALFVADRAGRTFSPEAVALAEMLAEQAAVALQNVRLFEERERQRREAEVIAELARTINGPLDLDTVLRRVTAAVRELCGADVSAVGLREPDSDLVTFRYVDEASQERWSQIRVEPGRGLGGRVLQTGLPARTADYAAETTVTPHYLRPVIDEGLRAMAVAPIRIENRIAGLLYAANRRPGAFTSRDEAVLQRLADHAGVAIRHRSMLAAEQEARARAESERRRLAELLGRVEAAQERLGFLADASTVLALSLDYEETLQSIAALAVPRLADWCIVHVLEEDGGVRRLAVVHSDPAKVRLAQWLQRRYPMDMKAPLGPARVMRTGRSEFYQELPDELLVAFAQDASHLAELRALGLRSAMIVPLTARGQVLGTISFVTAESGRRYTAPDLAVAEDLGRRAAFAVDHARLYRAAQRADRHKDEFLAILAHELRSPLTPILSAMRIIGRRVPDQPSVQRSREVVERQVRHLARLLDDLLDVSRISRGRIELRRIPVQLASVVADALETTRAQIDERRHRLTVSMPDSSITLMADPTRLAQVFTNLLVNAARYTPPGGEIAIAAAVDGEEAVVRVRDSGLGIPRDMLNRVFDPFAQVDVHRERGFGGLGIGLTLVRRLVELHGGSVTAHSEGLGHGSEFVVRLPVAAPGAAPPPASRRPTEAVSRHVLVIEDEADNRQMLREVLELEGHRVAVASDGASGVALALTERPDIALVDIGLPVLDGYEVARRLRKAFGQSIRLVALTGYGQEQDRARAREAGFDAHVVKPVELDDLLRIVTEMPASG